MNETLKRSLSGSVYVAILSLGIWYHPAGFIALFFVLMLGSLFEFNRMIGLKSIFPYIISILLFVTANVWNADHFTLIKLPYFLAGLLFLSFFSAFISVLFQSGKEAVTYLGKVFLSVTYIGVPFTLIAIIPFINHQFRYIHSTILGIFILVWINDSFAYIVGSLIGKHKLFERISPNKTIEGFFGGMLFTLAGSLVLYRIFGELSWGKWLAFGMIVSVFGVLGDLIESMFKRQAGVKDSGDLIPGHGGLLDRLDSIIFSAPFIFLYLIAVWE